VQVRLTEACVIAVLPGVPLEVKAGTVLDLRESLASLLVDAGFGHSPSKPQPRTHVPDWAIRTERW
jgi:hypothetical protein